MLAFTVYKSSKYLFDCVGATDGTQLQLDMTVNREALEALGVTTVDVVKRMDFAEVDKLISCCQQHPPQTIVMPATHGDVASFQKFVKYLKARQRAGVVILADGRLLILVPLDNDDLRLRCVVVNAKPSETSAALPSHVSTIRVDEAADGQLVQAEPQAQPGNARLPQQRIAKRRHVRARPYHRARAWQEKEADTSRQGSLTEQNPHVQAKVAAPTFAPNKDLTMLYSLPRLERAMQIAQLRQEYEAFRKHHFEVLQGWSNSNSNYTSEG